MSLQDLDLLVKSANRATQGGQSLDVWLHGAGRRTLHSWAQRAASSGATPRQPPPYALVGVSSVALGGLVPTGAWPAGVVGVGGAATHQAAYTGGSNPSAPGYWDPQMLAQLSLHLQNIGIREAVDRNNVPK